MAETRPSDPAAPHDHDHHHDRAHERAGSCRSDRWLPGTDVVLPSPRSAENVAAPQPAPVGRLHAIGPDGAASGRAVCLAPVVLLDPAVWSWPGSAGSAWPLCWTCLELTHASDGARHAAG